jgi:hypothetical protein
MDSLARTGLVLFGLLALHTLDHAINQPAREVPAISGLIGLLGFAIVALAVVLALMNNPYAPEAAILAGAGTVAGFIPVHLIGDWTPLSDPYWDFDANVLSWILLIAPMVAAAALTAEGFRRLGGRALPA